MQSDREFKAPWSRSLKVVSALGSLLFGGAMVVVAVVPKVPWWVRSSLGMILMGTLLGCLLWTVRSYQISQGVLLVHRLVWSTSIVLAGLRSVEAVPNVARSALKMCGNGGLFAFCGWFWNRRLGRFRMCATDLAKTVVLRFRDRTWVISPDRPDEFVRELIHYTHLDRNNP